MLDMEPEITTYTSSDGTVTPIAELNNFHLVNALLKTESKMCSALENLKPEVKLVRDVLKEEVLKRLYSNVAE